MVLRAYERGCWTRPFASTSSDVVEALGGRGLSSVGCERLGSARRYIPCASWRLVYPWVCIRYRDVPLDYQFRDLVPTCKGADTKLAFEDFLGI